MDRKTTVTKYAVDCWNGLNQTWVNATKRLFLTRPEAEKFQRTFAGQTRIREVPVTVFLPSVFR